MFAEQADSTRPMPTKTGIAFVFNLPRFVVTSLPMKFVVFRHPGWPALRGPKMSAAILLVFRPNVTNIELHIGRIGTRMVILLGYLPRPALLIFSMQVPVATSAGASGTPTCGGKIPS